FEFVGFRFERRDAWEASGGGPPVAIDELSWFDASTRATAAGAEPRLPGEVAAAADEAPCAVLGPGLAELALDGGHLVVRMRGGATRELATGEVGMVILLGTTDLSAGVLDHLLRAELTVVFADANGQARAALAADGPDDPRVMA